MNRNHEIVDNRGARDEALADELALLIDGATNYAIYMLDRQGIVTIWNRGAERINGWTAAEIVGRDFAVFYPAEQASAGKPRDDLARAHLLGRFEEDSWRLRKDGSEFLASVTMTALYDGSGTLRGFGEVIRDITDQKAAEAALESRERHLQSILDTVPDAMIVIAESGSICSFSAAAERLFGYTEADVVGRNVKILMPEPDHSRHDDYIARYLATGERRAIGYSRSVSGRKRDGQTFPMELAIGETVSGGQQLFTGFVRDLTERRRTELRVHQLQSELMHVTRLSAMGVMASTLAHELNQPLTAIANYLETTRDMLTVLDTDTVEIVRSALDEAGSQTIRAGQIVRRLREFIARGELEKSVTSLAELSKEAIGLGFAGAHEQGVATRFELDPTFDLVLVEPVQIEQVFINLIHNAIHAMQGFPTRELTISSARHDRELVKVTVADTGSGIAPEVADRLFQAFVTTKDDGMGLGLSICRTIVEAHGGRIWMEPAAQGGSAFHFTLMRGDGKTDE